MHSTAQDGSTCVLRPAAHCLADVEHTSWVPNASPQGEIAPSPRRALRWPALTARFGAERAHLRGGVELLLVVRVSPRSGHAGPGTLPDMTDRPRPAKGAAKPYVAVFLRLDYYVHGWDKLRRAAVTALVDCGVSPADAEEQVTSPADALHALFETRPNAGNEPGAEVQVEYLAAVPVEQGGPVLLEDSPWAPLFDAEEDGA